MYDAVTFDHEYVTWLSRVGQENRQPFPATQIFNMDNLKAYDHTI